MVGRIARLVTAAACVAVLAGQVAVTGAASGGAELPQLRGVSSRLDRGISAIVIEATEPVAYVTSQPDPLTVLVDMRNVRCGRPERRRPSCAPVNAVRVEQATAADGSPVARVRVGLAHAAAHRVRASAELIVVEVARDTAGASPAAAPAPRRPRAPLPASRPLELRRRARLARPATRSLWRSSAMAC